MRGLGGKQCAVGNQIGDRLTGVDFCGDSWFRGKNSGFFIAISRGFPAKEIERNAGEWRDIGGCGGRL